MDITNFIMENTIWLIIFCVLILMALIGYSAEKKRNKGATTSQLKENPVTPPPLEMPIEQSVVQTPEVSVQQPITNTDLVSNIYNANMVPPNPGVVPVTNDTVPATVTATGEDLTVPLEGATNTSVPVDNLNADVSNLVEPHSDIQSSSDLAVNDISALMDGTKKEENNTEDVWKF